MSLLQRLFAAAAPAVVMALVLQGTVTAQTPVPEAPVPATGDWREIPADNLLVIDSTKGRIVVEMRSEVAPEHVERIRTLARMGFYDGLQFFRVIDEFMAQTGDQANTGAGPSPLPPLQGNFTFRRGADDGVLVGRTANEANFGFMGPMAFYSQPDDLAFMTADGRVRAWGLFCTGVAGMARTQAPDSAATQFFLMRGYVDFLDQQYTPWGRVVLGQEVVDALNTGEPPRSPDLMTQVRVASDMPEGERPNLWRVDPASAAFRAQVAAVQAARGPEFTPCDVIPQVEAR